MKNRSNLLVVADLFLDRVVQHNVASVLSKACLVSAVAVAYFGSFGVLGTICFTACVLGAAVGYKIQCVIAKALDEKNPFIRVLKEGRVLILMNDGSFAHLQLNKNYTPSFCCLKRKFHWNELKVVPKESLSISGTIPGDPQAFFSDITQFKKPYWYNGVESQLRQQGLDVIFA